MLSEKQLEILKQLRKNQDDALFSDTEIKDFIGNHKDETYFPSSVIIERYNKLKDFGYDVFILGNKNLDSLYVVFRSKNDEVLYFINGRGTGTILLLNIHPFYNGVIDRDAEYEKAELPSFTTETLTKEIVEESIKKCDDLFNLYNRLIKFYWEKANKTLQNLYTLKNDDPIYKDMKIDRSDFCKENMFFTAKIFTDFFTYEYSYFMHESNFKVKTNYDEFQNFVQCSEENQKVILALIEKIKKDTLI